nr:MAG TPA: hypothetical protein [Caudoviricetes sp.]
MQYLFFIFLRKDLHCRSIKIYKIHQIKYIIHFKILHLIFHY